MFARLFRKSKPRVRDTNPVPTLEKLEETLRLLEKKEKVLSKKVDDEVEKAKAFSARKDKRAAIQCLKRKKLFEQQIENLSNYQMRICDQMNMLEGAKDTAETVGALRTGAATMKALQKETSIEDVDKTMTELNEQAENMKQIQQALSVPIGPTADFDEDDLEAELEELEGLELEERLLQPVMPTPLPAVKNQPRKQVARPTYRIQAAEEDELAALQAELAL